MNPEQPTGSELLRVFLSFNFQKETKNTVDAFKDVAKAEGFDVVTGEPPHHEPPPPFVRAKILSCDLFAALMMATDRSSKTSAWISNELGIAYAVDLPLLICKEHSIKDIGLANMATCYLEFDPANLGGFKDALRAFLRNVRNDHHLRSKLTLGNFISGLAKQALSGRLSKFDENPQAMDELVTAVDRIVEAYDLHRFAYGESADFEIKHVRHLPEKRIIAKHVLETFLKCYDGQSKAWTFMDSGTVAYSICEEIVRQALKIPVMTNNLAGCRLLSKINAYPSFIIPGEVESRYVAALGEECMDFLQGVLRKSDVASPGKKIELSIVAATSISSNTGLCGNDGRHNRLKRTLLEQCPRSVIAFEGEKLLEPSGSPIFESEENWLAFAEKCKGTERVKFVTHVPELFEKLSHDERRLFSREIEKLVKLFDLKNVMVLGMKLGQ